MRKDTKNRQIAPKSPTYIKHFIKQYRFINKIQYQEKDQRSGISFFFSDHLFISLRRIVNDLLTKVIKRSTMHNIELDEYGAQQRSNRKHT